MVRPAGGHGARARPPATGGPVVTDLLRPRGAGRRRVPADRCVSPLARRRERRAQGEAEGGHRAGPGDAGEARRHRRPGPGGAEPAREPGQDAQQGGAVRRPDRRPRPPQRDGAPPAAGEPGEEAQPRADDQEQDVAGAQGVPDGVFGGRRPPGGRQQGLQEA